MSDHDHTDGTCDGGCRNRQCWLYGMRHCHWKQP